MYALSVEGETEFFANGVLVSNCDAALYAWRYAHSFLATLAPPVRPKEGTEEYMKLIEKEYDERMAKPVEKKEFWEADPDYEANQEWLD